MPTKRKTKTRFVAVGDIFLGDQPFYLGFGVRSLAQRKGYDTFFTEVKDTLAQYDLVVGNLETVIARKSTVQSPKSAGLVDRADPEAATAIHDAGINLVGLANNHIFEYGESGLNETVMNLDATGIGWVGKRNYRIREIDGQEVAFLSWSLLPDTYWPALEPADYYNVASTITPILEEVSEARIAADFVVLLLHWGNESVPRPSIKQQEIGRLLIDSGVDVILEHHPHILQPIERYGGGVIAYSLGNFVMDSWEEAARTSAILEVTLGARIDFRVIPVYINKHKYRPALIRNEAERSRVLSALEYADPLEDSAYFQVVHQERKRYRLSSVKHFARNFHRIGFRNLAWVLGWGLRRIVFLLIIAGKEKKEPDVVYRGPMH